MPPGRKIWITLWALASRKSYFLASARACRWKKSARVKPNPPIAPTVSRLRRLRRLSVQRIEGTPSRGRLQGQQFRGTSHAASSGLVGGKSGGNEAGPG